MAQNQFSWLDPSEYPFRSQHFSINGQQMHFIDEGEGDTLLFVHGTPSWSFDFRNVIKTLCNHYRCIAIDHIGFGLSDKPADYDYSTKRHSATLEAFILEKDLKNITLIAHDFGGPIALNVAIGHPGRFSRLVILNSWLWSSEGDPDFIKLSKILKSPLLPFLYKQLNFSPRMVLPSSFGDKKPDKKTLRHYTRPFANSSQRNGALAFARSLLRDQAWFESLWQQKEAISHKPLLLIWGMKDPVIKPHNLHKFASGFANVRIEQMERCGHFPQEEAPEKVAQCILDFVEHS